MNHSMECYNFSKDSDNNWPTEKPWSPTFTVILTVIISIVMICNIFGNFLVIAVIVRHRGMQTRTNLFLMNLAIADFMVGLLVAPFSLATILKGGWIFGEIMCNVSGFMNAFCYVTSIHTLMYISVHKYFSITRPFSRFVTVARIRIMMAAAWLWAAFIATMTITGLSSVCYKYGTSQCGPVYPRTMKTYAHHIIVQVTVIFIPLCVLCFTYASMYREIQAHTKRLQQNTRLREDTILAQQKKVFFTLFIVLACFILCWLPYHIYSMYVTINRAENFNTHLNPVAYLFAYINSACNPIIYALRSPAFRQGYKEILCWEKAPIFSDDTIHEESASVLQFLNSLRGPKPGSRNLRQGSVVSIQSVTSNHSMTSRSLPKMSLPTMKGNSVIKKDGSVVIMKDGKIVCVRQDVGNKKSIDSPLFIDETPSSLPAIPVYPSGLYRRENSMPQDTYDTNEPEQETGLEATESYSPNLGNVFDFEIIEEEESNMDENGLEQGNAKNENKESNMRSQHEEKDNSFKDRFECVDNRTEVNKDSLDSNHLPDSSFSLLGENSAEVKTSNGHCRGQEKL